MAKILLYIYEIVQHAVQKYIDQTREAYYALDPIQVDSVPSAINADYRSLHIGNNHYLVAAFVILYTIGDSAAILYGASWHYSHTDLPELWTHRVFPRSLWQECDIISTIAMISVCILYCFVLFCPKLDAKYVIVLTKMYNRKKCTVQMVQNQKGMALTACYSMNNVHVH